MNKDIKQMIRIRGAKEHNLQNIDIDIPRDELVVITGLSGSGKSSLAFDTIYAEGQRRYMESLSSYARQFLGQMEKPEVESIEGLPPAIAIDQKSTNRNPRSTVGTVTEIYDYLRLLYARVGVPHCPECGKEIKKQTVDQMVDAICELPSGTKFQLLSPVVRGRKGEHVKVLESAARSGYVRARVDGNMYELTEEIKLDKNIKHNIEIVVDRLVMKDGINKRLTDSLNSPIPKPLEAVKGMYRYFTHADNPEKAQYDPADIITLNGFNILDFADCSRSEVLRTLKELQSLIMNQDFIEYSDFMDYVLLNGSELEFDVASGHTIFFNSYLKSRRMRSQSFNSAP